MNPRAESARPATRSSQGGFIMLSMILITVLLVSLTMGYARHSILALDETEATVDDQLDENAVGSGVIYARQALRATGGTVSAAHLLGDERTVSVSVQDAGSALRSITIQSLRAGQAQTVNALAEVYPAVDEQLPALTSDAQRAVWEFPGLVDVTADQSWSDTDLTGIVLLRKGVEVTFDDVVLRGTIVSENALSDGTWSSSEATSIRVTGGLLVEPGSTLSGCAIIAPDAALVGTSGSALQIHGVVVADSVNVAGTSVFHGQLATASEPVLGGSTDFPGAGRAPRPWPTSLESTTQHIGRLVFTVDEPTEAERSAIMGFSWGPGVHDETDSVDGIDGGTANQAQAPLGNTPQVPQDP